MTIQRGGYAAPLFCIANDQNVMGSAADRMILGEGW
jgi:hypothetical protein